jgi:tetratricopeptide (TPR) repeat protein
MWKSPLVLWTLIACGAFLGCIAPASASSRDHATSHKAHCAKKLDPKNLPDAQALTDRGKQAFIQGKYDEAIRLFNDAYCVLPAPLFRYNVSSVYKKLNDCDNAMLFGKLYLRQADLQDKEDARQWVTSLQHECTHISIESEPSGASIWIDRDTGDPVGHAPWTGWVFPGKHTILARSQGLVDETQWIDVPAGGHTPIQLKLTLDALPPAPGGEVPTVELAPATPAAPAPAPAPVVHLNAPIADAQALLDSLQPGAVDEATLHALRGLALHQRGSFLKATREYDAALATKPNDPDIGQLRAQNLLKLVELNQTVASLEQAQALAPDREDIAAQLARLYAGMDQREKAAAEQLRADRIAASGREAARVNLKPKEIKTIAMPGLFTPMFASASGPQDDSYLGRVLPALIGRDLARSPYVELVAPGQPPPSGTYYAVDGQILVVPATPGIAAQLQIVARLVEAKSGAVVRSSARSGSLQDFSRLQHETALDLLEQFVPVTPQERERVNLALPIEQLDSLKLLAAALDARAHGELPKALDLLRQARASDIGNVVATEELLATKKALGARTTEHVGNELENSLSARLAKLSRVEVVNGGGAAVPPAANQPAGAAPSSPGPTAATTAAVDTVITGSYSFMKGGALTVQVRCVDVETRTETFSVQVSSSEPGLIRVEDELADGIARGLLGSLSEDDAHLIHFEQPVAPPPSSVPAPAPATAGTGATPAPVPVAAAQPSAPAAPGPATAPAGAAAPPPATASTPAAPGTSAAALPPRDSSGPGPQPPGKGDLFQLDFRAQGLTNKLAVPPVGFDLTLLSGVVSANILTVKFNWIFGTVTNHFAPLTASSPTALLLVDSGLDIELDFLWKSIGFDLAAAGTAGYLQTQRSTALFYGVRPRGGILLQAGHFQVAGDIGWQVNGTYHAASGDRVANDLSGLFVQANLAYRFDELALALPEGSELGYRAHFVVPEGKAAYRSYGLGFAKPGGFILQNDLILSGTIDRVRMGVLVGIGEWPATSPESSRFQMQELGFDFQLSLFARRTTFNPFIGWRFAADRATGSGLGSCGSTSVGCWGGIVAPRLGVDVNVVAGLLVEVGWGYDFQFSQLTVIKGKLGIGDPGNYSGYGADVGLSYKF